MPSLIPSRQVSTKLVNLKGPSQEKSGLVHEEGDFLLPLQRRQKVHSLRGLMSQKLHRLHDLHSSQRSRLVQFRLL